MFKENSDLILENNVTDLNKSHEKIETKPVPEINETDPERQLQTDEQEAIRLEQSISTTKTAINQTREKLGLPPSNENPPSVLQASEKITSLRKNGKQKSPELRNFTKHYSGFWREQLAKKVIDARTKFSQKKTTVQEENLRRGETKLTLEAEVSTLENEISKIQSEMENCKVKLEEEKCRLAYRIASLLGRKKEILVESALKESETELERLQRELDEKKKLMGECEEVVIDESELSGAKEEVRRFYDEQKGIHDIFEQEKIRERDITHVSQDKKVLFLHTLPIDGLMGNTSENNLILDTEKMTSIDKTKVVLGIEPTLSASTISLSGKDTEKGFKTMYPVGLIIGEGTVLSAYGGDAGTYADNPFVRRSKYDHTLKSSVQEDISGNLQKAIKRESGSGTTVSDADRYNEVVVENPKVSGVFLDTKKFSGNEHFQNTGVEAIKQALRMSKEFGLPVYDIHPDGEIIDITSGDFRTVKQEEVLSYQCSLDIETKIQGVREVLKTQEKSNPEIQRKLAEISNQEKSDQTLIENQEKRAAYSSKAEECLKALEYESTAKYVNRFSGMELEEILKVMASQGVKEQGLEKVRSLFGGRTTEERTAYCESILQKAEALKNLIK